MDLAAFFWCLANSALKFGDIPAETLISELVLQGHNFIHDFITSSGFLSVIYMFKFI